MATSTKPKLRQTSRCTPPSAAPRPGPLPTAPRHGLASRGSQNQKTQWASAQTSSSNSHRNACCDEQLSAPLHLSSATSLSNSPTPMGSMHWMSMSIILVSRNLANPGTLSRKKSVKPDASRHDKHDGQQRHHQHGPAQAHPASAPKTTINSAIKMAPKVKRPATERAAPPNTRGLLPPLMSGTRMLHHSPRPMEYCKMYSLSKPVSALPPRPWGQQHFSPGGVRRVVQGGLDQSRIGKMASPQPANKHPR